MKRTIISQLKKSKENPFRKPLILTGARQVGKTYILKEFGAQEYENVAYINCDGNSEIADIFADDYDMRRVLMVIGAISKQPIMAGKTLIILDEIQELRKGITSLKYFCENAPEYHVAVAGSLLGVAMHQGESAPVGKVDILRLFHYNGREQCSCLVLIEEANAYRIPVAGHGFRSVVFHKAKKRAVRASITRTAFTHSQRLRRFPCVISYRARKAAMVVKAPLQTITAVSALSTVCAGKRLFPYRIAPALTVRPFSQ